MAMRWAVQTDDDANIPMRGSESDPTDSARQVRRCDVMSNRALFSVAGMTAQGGLQARGGGCAGWAREGAQSSVSTHHITLRC
eukprot:1020776-Rhodomonas_salina.2